MLLKIADNYPAANRSFLVAGALLHDIGKIVEFVYDKKIGYSDVGRLVGHISMGSTLVETHCSRIAEFPSDKKVLLQHMLLSHHGVLEYGSPKRPKTLEALILHHCDQIDAQVSNFLEHCPLDASPESEARWRYSNMLDRYLFATANDVEGSDMFEQLAYPPPVTGGNDVPNPGDAGRKPTPGTKPQDNHR